ncbi:expressed unknown protein [Seminavis robusta]|uniref:DNA replication complex GINS protein PSF3 n=1 Tax=Seminavis robusta TaxID=568900 RepID=A0A9N8EDB9_9STRA|nr:expressed unknown protein [Seminavis robusta]|eukprot:Sro782_g201830.1 n/a (278) ;mRNA; r:47956-48789
MKTLPLASPKTIGTDLEVVLPEYSKIEIPTWLTGKLAKDSKTPVLHAWTCDLTNRFGPEGDKDIADTFMDQPYMDHHVYLVAFLQLAFMKADSVCAQHQRKMLQIVQYPRGRGNPKLSQELYIRMIAQFLIASVKLGLSQEALKKAEKQLRSHTSSFAKKTTPVGGVKAPHILHKIRMLEDKDNLTALGIRENTSSTSPSLLVGGCDETSADLSTESNHSSSLFGKPSHQGDDEKKHKKMHAKEKPKRSSSSNPFAWLKGTIWASKPKNHTPGAVSA